MLRVFQFSSLAKKVTIDENTKIMIFFIISNGFLLPNKIFFTNNLNGYPFIFSFCTKIQTELLESIAVYNEILFRKTGMKNRKMTSSPD